MTKPMTLEQKKRKILDKWLDWRIDNLQLRSRRADALTVRREWMTLMGLSRHEIDADCGPTAVADLDEELAHLDGMRQLQTLWETKR